MTYRAPLDDYQFLFRVCFPLSELEGTMRFPDFESSDAEPFLQAAARLAEDALAPLQRAGDVHPAYLENGVVRTSPGYERGYRLIAEGGWAGMAAQPEFGGTGLPVSILNAANEMINGACLALGLNPLLTQSQIDALELHANEEVKRIFLPKLVSGEWSGTMNITEPQAGSDVGALRTKAVPADGSRFLISGQKIFVSWGDADFAKNICHLVLARLPGAEPGTKGVSLFMVPKFLPDKSGHPGLKNGISTLSIEKKLGLHGSPTAVLQYDGAVGWLVGEPHGGMKAMFSMMNVARLGVGCQGVAVAEAAYQQSLEYALARKQGKPIKTDGTGTIIDHANVRRILALMKAQIYSARSICSACAYAIDIARATGGQKWADRAAFLTPIAKAYGSDTGFEVASLGIQVYGGAGYIEETGATQFLRDVLVTTIYEGTNGIQALDLAGRKLANTGDAAFALLDEIEECSRSSRAHAPDLSSDLAQSAAKLKEATGWMIRQSSMNQRYAGACAYLRAMALLLGASNHLKALVAVNGKGPRAALARVFVKRALPALSGHCDEATLGAEDLHFLDFQGQVA